MTLLQQRVASSVSSAVKGYGRVAGAEGDDVRRRALLAGIAGLAGGVLLQERATVTARMRNMLVSPTMSATLSVPELRHGLQRAAAAFARCEYIETANLLLPVITANAVADPNTRAHTVVRAQGYTLATRLLIKLHENSMAWSTADRARSAAFAASDRTAAAEAQRVTAIVMRRTGHGPAALDLVVKTATDLLASGLDTDAGERAYGRLLSTAAYTAAIDGDRHHATEWIEAAGCGKPSQAVDVYRIGIARVLGDYGLALEVASTIDPVQLETPLRRARYYEDVALTYQALGRSTDAYAALRTAERSTPQEVRHRRWAQQLASELLNRSRTASLPGVREFAQRIGVVA